jgi:hypothetical protein
MIVYFNECYNILIFNRLIYKKQQIFLRNDKNVIFINHYLKINHALTILFLNVKKTIN